jgi:hypothetical protein
LPRGIYRTVKSGEDYAYVDTLFWEIPRAEYEKEGCKPPFDDLPTKEMYDEWRLRNR